MLRASAYGAGVLAIACVLGSGFVRCPVAMLTHQPCPGCGSTRAIRALLALDFGTAFRMNPTAPFVVLAIGVIVAQGLWNVARDGNAGDLGLRGPSRWAIYGLCAATLLEVPIWALRFFGLFGGPVPV